MTNQIKIVISAVIFLGIIGAAWYINNLRHNVELLNTTIVAQEKALKEYRSAQRFLEDTIKDNDIRAKKLANQLKDNKKVVDDLRKDLSNNDVDNILQKKAKLFEKIIRKGTLQYYKDLEETTKWSKE